jgi:pectate lyase
MFVIRRTVLFVALLAVASFFLIDAAVSADGDNFPAFPGAEGAGAYTVGGRGGVVLAVTTLADFDPHKEAQIKGSLRAAVMARGPRIIIFRVAGNIALKRDLTINEPFVTIAGQSAPGGGICLTNYGLGIDTHDVVLRHLRIRPGDVEKKECDAISCSGQNVIIDHCSTSWAIDEVLSTNGNSSNVSVQWCLITESLNKSYHHKGSHGYGSLISGPGEISYHHNVYAYHRSRNPRPGSVLLDFRNNLIFGWGDRAGYCGDERLKMNYVANDLRPRGYSKSAEYAFLPGGLKPRIFIAENRLTPSNKPLEDDWALIKAPKGITNEQAREQLQVKQPFATSEVTTEPAERATDRILVEGGASLPLRDAVDTRVVQQIRESTGNLIDSQNDVGGWPELSAGVAPVDSDGDGMPDEWEAKYGLDPQRPAGLADDRDNDGFTDIEEFLNGTDPRIKDLWIFPPKVESSVGDAFVGSNRVTLSTRTDGAEIHYTLDGSAPQLTSPLFQKAIELDHSAILRASAFLDGQKSHVRNARFERLEWQQPVTPSSIQPGIRYEYYEKTDWAGFPDFSSLDVISSGIQPQINLAPRKREDAFGLRWIGYFHAPHEGVYRFYLRCSPLGQVLIHDRLLVESEGRRCEHSGAIAFKPGLHPLVFQIYFASDDNKTLEISYEGPGIPLQPIPSSSLFCAQP